MIGQGGSEEVREMDMLMCVILSLIVNICLLRFFTWKIYDKVYERIKILFESYFGTIKEAVQESVSKNTNLH